MRQQDCTCHGFHTDAAGREVSTETLWLLRQMETCPVERRALDRVIASR